MKNLLFLVVFSITSLSFCQSSIEVYSEILKVIKSSSDFQEYKNTRKNNFKVSPNLYSFCEYFLFIETHIENSKNYCKDLDIDNEKTLLRKDIKKLSGKRKKTHVVYFSETVDNYISVEVINKKWKHESLLYLFKIDETNKVEMINAEIIFKN